MNDAQLLAFLNVLFWGCFELEMLRYELTGVPGTLSEAFMEVWGAPR